MKSYETETKLQKTFNSFLMLLTGPLQQPCTNKKTKVNATLLTNHSSFVQLKTLSKQKINSSEKRINFKKKQYLNTSNFATTIRTSKVTVLKNILITTKKTQKRICLLLDP